MKKNMIILGFWVVMMHWAVGVVGQGWERMLPAFANGELVHSLEQDNEHFLTLINYSFDFYLVNLDSNGQVLTKRKFDFGEREFAIDIIKTEDGGYMILYKRSPNVSGGFPQENRGIGLLKLDAQFQVVFRTLKSIEWETLQSFTARNVFQKNDGYVVIGTISYVALEDPNSSFVASFDTLGIYINQKTIGGYFPNGLKNMDGEFVISTTTKQGLSNYFMILQKLDNTGNQILWNMSYLIKPGLQFSLALDGGYTLFGNSPDYSLAMIHTDSIGNQLWIKDDFDSTLNSHYFSKIITVSDGYLLAGGINDFFVIAKVNQLGELISCSKYGLPSTFDISGKILNLNDGGYLLLGRSSIGGGVFYPHILRFDSAGNTFTSSISGNLLADNQGDCIADTLSSAPTYIQAFKGCELVAQAYPDTLGNWTMKVDTGNIVIVPMYAGGATTFCPDTITQVVAPLDSLTGLNFTSYYHPLQMDSVFGYVFEDVDGDCVQDAFEQGYAGWTIKLSYWNMFSYNPTTTTDANGRFVFVAPINLHNGMTFNVLPNGDPADGLNCHVTCSDNQHPITAGATTYQANFGVHCDTLPPCPGMEVSIATDHIRPCDTSHYVVSYCNRGAVEAENAYITVQFDTLISVVSSIMPFTTLADNTYRFYLGTMGVEACGSFSIEAALACDPLLTGLTFCATAHAYPDTVCTIPAATWDGAQIKVEGTCEQDSVVFDIQNIGDNNMLQSLDYIVIEDNVLRQSGTFQLPAGDAKRVAIEADGHFYRLVAGQSAGFNSQNQPLAWVEACDANSSGNPSVGFVNQYTLGDEEPWLDVFCLPAVNSYDPNDKTGFPQGVYAAHQIDQNVEMDYLIRFQNTGTAEAYNIEIRDTLSGYLDITSVRPGASSHAYTFNLEGENVVVFRFDDINLPDSTTNEAASHGFVQFRVKQQPNVPLNSVIYNQAAIYFDANSPIITNQTFHTVGKDFLIFTTESPDKQEITFFIYPNPARDFATFSLESKYTLPLPMTLRLYSPAGVLVLETAMESNMYTLNTQSLSDGMWFYEVIGDGRSIGRGKFVKFNH